MVVSFARSSNSPESLAAVQVAKTFVKNVKFINITCAPEGKLAVESEGDADQLTLLIPRANDKGFAMTCLLYTSCYVVTTSAAPNNAAGTGKRD